MTKSQSLCFDLAGLQRLLAECNSDAAAASQLRVRIAIARMELFAEHLRESWERSEAVYRWLAGERDHPAVVAALKRFERE